MKTFFTLTVLFTATVLVSAADADKAINGSYTVKSMTRGGMEAPEEAVKGFKSFVIKDGTIAFEINDRKEKGDFTTDAKQKPAHIDITPSTGPDANKTMKGIYKLENGKLTICINHDGDRPKDFDDKSEHISTIVLQRKDDKK